jgi:predicted permease
VPISMLEVFYSGSNRLEDRGARWAEAYVRLKPGATRSQAQQEISAIATRLEAEYPATNRGRGIKVWALWETPFNHAGELLPIVQIMVIVVVFVLLIVCANVGNLLLVRSFARQHEMTVRLAIGADRGRLLRQLVTEGLLLSVCGAVGGMLLAYWCRQALPLLFPVRGGEVMYLPGEIDARVLGLSAAICLVATLAVGLVPSFQIRHLAIADSLKTEATSVMGARGRAWFRSSLVVLQVTLSFMLLVGATLLIQSLRNIRTTSSGFSTTRVLDTWIPLAAAGYDAPRARTFQEELIQRVRALPGVEAAAYARVVPLGYEGYSSTPIAVDGYEPQPNEQPAADYNEVSPDYFATMGIPLMPSLVKREQLVAASSVSRSTAQMTTIVGPVPAGFVIKTLGVAWAFFVDAISFLFIIGVLWKLPDPPESQTTRKAMLHSIAEGIAYVGKDVPLRSLMLLATILNFSIAGPVSVGLAYLTNTRFGSPAVYGIVISAVAAGSC